MRFYVATAIRYSIGLIGGIGPTGIFSKCPRMTALAQCRGGAGGDGQRPSNCGGPV